MCDWNHDFERKMAARAARKLFKYENKLGDRMTFSQKVNFQQAKELTTMFGVNS